MPKLCTVVILLASGSLLAQTGKPSAGKTTTAHKRTPAATTAKPEPKAIFHTTAGNLTCTLFPDKTPKTYANFVGLATGTKDWKNPVSGATKHKTPLYDGTIFHRVIPNFMIQGGDPAGNGSGDPGYTFEDEIRSDLSFDQPGRLAMANSGPNTNGSQFFITEVPTPHLNGHHTIFGQCSPASVALVKQIARRARDPRDDKPFTPVRITHVEIVQPGAAAHKAGAAHHPTTRRTTKPKASTTQ